MAAVKGILTVDDPNGMHARPAGQLAAALRSCGAATKLTFGDRYADGGQLFSVMALGAKRGDRIGLMLEGERSTEAARKIGAFCENNPAFSVSFL